MRITIRMTALAAAATLFASLAAAQESPSAEEAYKDIEANYGVVPGFMKVYPKIAIAGAWAMTKGLDSKESALEPKVKSLISLAVAAQIPCRYCTWIETRLARQSGATDEEISEAVAQAAMTRHWSTVLNGHQIDFETFKSEFGGD